MSCSSGRVGVGYEGDTCNFTCNTGYELTGSDTRTCQSNGNWSGSDDVCRRGMYNHITVINLNLCKCRYYKHISMHAHIYVIFNKIVKCENLATFNLLNIH